MKIYEVRDDNDMHDLTIPAIPCACVLASENRVFPQVMAENLRGEMFSPAHTLESWLEKPGKAS